MTIREYLCKAEAENTRRRAEQLTAIGAPQIILDRCAEVEAELTAGKLTCSGETALLDAEYTGHEVRKGRGGKVYVKFEGGILYFPQAKYGRYITKEEKQA